MGLTLAVVPSRTVKPKSIKLQEGDGVQVAAFEDDEDDSECPPFAHVPAPLASTILEEMLACGPSKWVVRVACVRVRVMWLLTAINTRCCLSYICVFVHASCTEVHLLFGRGQLEFSA